MCGSGKRQQDQLWRKALTRAHVGRDELWNRDNPGQHVSIHAPTRGATRPKADPPGAGGVSIHAPTRGATEAGRADPRKNEVSIHAPTRGATSHRQPHTLIAAVSIHAPTRGATNRGEVDAIHVLFQSTRPRGARRFRTSFLRGQRCFNPRAHAGRDPVSSRERKNAMFQSTRPRGARRATVPTSAQPGRHDVSIHAPTRGATEPQSTKRKGELFQSTRPRGARPRTCSTSTKCGRFNPRAHAGRDRNDPPNRLCESGFNPRAHAGRDSRTARRYSGLLFHPTRSS